MRNSIRTSLSARFDTVLVDELLAAYDETKRNFYLGGLRLSAVEGGRFCEACFRLLEQETQGGSFTPLGQSLDTEKLIRRLSGLPATQFNDSIRLHIPRALRVVYDIRNKRDVAHLNDGIDPNMQDATLVSGTLDWIVAELVRVFCKINPNDAQAIVDSLVTRKAPVIQDFDGHLKVLNADLGASEVLLLLLYQRGQQGASFSELDSWVASPMRKNLRRTLSRLVSDRAFVHQSGNDYFITHTGLREVERRQLLHL